MKTLTCPSPRLLENHVSHFNEDLKDHQQILFGRKTKHEVWGPKLGIKIKESVSSDRFIFKSHCYWLLEHLVRGLFSYPANLKVCLTFLDESIFPNTFCHTFACSIERTKHKWETKSELSDGWLVPSSVNSLQLRYTFLSAAIGQKPRNYLSCCCCSSPFG